jgi:hypothetical protein
MSPCDRVPVIEDFVMAFYMNKKMASWFSQGMFMFCN